jgi:hypothetical protein
MIELELPDLPRWALAHGIAATPDAWRAPLGAGFALGHDRTQVIIIAGDADAAATRALATARPAHTLLLPREHHALAASLGRPIARALLHTLADPDALPDLDGAVPLTDDAPLDHVPAPLAAELAAARAAGPVWTVWLDDLPAAFAYAPWRSAAWFDVSVDTLPGARQLGLGPIVAAAMIRQERAQRREPVWAADAHNHASLRLARALGFGAPIDELLIAAP